MAQQVDVQSRTSRGRSPAHEEHSSLEIEGMGMARQAQAVKKAFHCIVTAQKGVRRARCFGEVFEVNGRIIH